MSRSYRRYDPDQPLLLPPSLRDWLTKAHAPRFFFVQSAPFHQRPQDGQAWTSERNVSLHDGCQIQFFQLQCNQFAIRLHAALTERAARLRSRVTYLDREISERHEHRDRPKRFADSTDRIAVDRFAPLLVGGVSPVRISTRTSQ